MNRKKKLFYIIMMGVSLVKAQEVSIKKIDSVIQKLDLSNKGLTKIPDLSNKLIKELDLSNNKIDSIIYNHLPRGLEKINLSYNNFTDNFNNNFILNLSDNQTCINSIKKINLSHNKIHFLVLKCSCDSIDVSNNQLYQINGDAKRINYLDISNNPNLNPSSLGIDYRYIKNIVRTNIQSEEPLGSWLIQPPANEKLPEGCYLITNDEATKQKKKTSRKRKKRRE